MPSGEKLFQPKINKKSEILDKKVTNKYLSQTSRNSEHEKSQSAALKSAERPNLILQKGKEYKERNEKRRLDKKDEDLKHCTFAPKIITKSRHRQQLVKPGAMDEEYKEPQML
jgi:hypothetical protein